MKPEGFPLISAIEYGNGRVVIGGSNMCFCDTTYVLPNLPSWAVSTLAGADNQQFALNVVNWLANGATSSLKIASPTIGDIFAFGENINFIGHQTGAVTNIEWVDNGGVPFAQGLSASRSDLSPGTHTITLRGTNAGNTVSDSITLIVFKSLKIKNLDAPFGIDPFADNASVSYRAAETRFQAIGCINNTEIGTVPVNWEIQGEGGRVNTPLRTGILNELSGPGGTPLPLRIGNIDGKESVSNSSMVTFYSYLPSNLTGPIKLTATNGSLPPVSVTIRIKQPTVKFAVKVVNGLIPDPTISIPFWIQAAKDVWGQEHIIDVEGSISTGIDNPNPPYTRLPPEESGEYLLKKHPTFLNPIESDAIAIKHFGSNAISRQAFDLFQNRVLDEKNNVINFYVTHFFCAVEYEKKGTKKVAKMEELPYASTINSFYTKRNSSSEKLSKNQVGILLSNLPSNQKAPELIELNYLTLPHELGHMLNLDHSTIEGNIMWRNQMAIGKDITSAQLKIILDHAKTKGPEVFFLEEK